MNVLTSELFSTGVFKFLVRNTAVGHTKLVLVVEIIFSEGVKSHILLKLNMVEKIAFL